MGDDNIGSSPIGKIARLFLTISEYTAGIVGYLAAITGRLETTKYPKSVAILTLAITTILFWVLRWSQISRRKAGSKAKTVSRSKKGRIRAYIDRLFDPLRSSNKNVYRIPLTRRRSETAFLCILTLITIGRAGMQFPDILQEVNPPPYALQPPCDREQNKTRAVVADFNETSAYQVLFEDRLFDEMQRQEKGNAQICRLKKVIKDRDQALSAQEATAASVLIWGRSDMDGVDVNLEVRGLEDFSEDIWSFRGITSGLSPDEAEHLTFLTHYAFSLLRYIDGQYQEARTELEAALAEADGKSWTMRDGNKTDLADAAFLLGLVYQDSDQLENARKNYEKAVGYDPALDKALLNNGQICMELQDQTCAMNAFTTLIDRKSKLAVSAYINRAYLQPEDLAEQDLAAAITLSPERGYPVRGELRLGWGNFSGAISDLQAAIRLTPIDAYLYHYLGQALLLSGDYEKAKQTYNIVIPHLDEEIRVSFINELKDLPAPPNADEHFQETIAQIINVLKEAKLP